jgi:3-hydroxymyristoyl/3-hydroxydecanoyl-(acyl carrier protein) dehydratase
MNTINNALKNIPIAATHGVNQITAVLTLPQDYPAFQGHFPEQKILPAVSSLQILIQVMERTLNKSFQVHQISKCHFKNPILPDEELQIQLDYEHEMETIKIRANIRSGDNIKSICHLILKQRGVFSETM